MRSLVAAFVLASAGAGILLAQPLTCPAASAATAHPCDTFPYHVQMHRPDTRAFVDLYGIDRFASQSSCDRARDAQFRRNMAVVEFYRAHGDQQYQADKIGPCHCDMTVERSSPNYLGDMQRIAQLRLAAEVRQRVRERLLDRDVPSDSDLVRLPPQTMNPLVGGPKIVRLPQRAATAEIAGPAKNLPRPPPPPPPRRRRPCPPPRSPPTMTIPPRSSSATKRSASRTSSRPPTP